MDPEFSEFSYGFALTHEIVNRWEGEGITAAPSCPSLYQEGQPGGGYDVRLDLPGVPLILQFKISERMLRRTASEWHHFNAPYYRFWMHARRHSDQHDLLVALDDGSAEVYYAAPTIHEVSHLNQAFLLGRLQQSSIFFRPAEIGTLPDEDAHCMAFQTGASVGLRCSEPKKVPVSGFGDGFASVLRQRIRGQSLQNSRDYFEKIADEIERRSAKRVQLNPDQVSSRRREWPSAIRAGYLARTVLGAELLWVLDEARLSPEELRRLHGR